LGVSLIMDTDRRNWKHRLLDTLPERLRIAVAASWTYRRKMGHWPNLIAPRDFSELIQLRKICDRDPRLPLYADKLRVKDHIRDRLGEDWLIPTLWSGQTLPPLTERHWPVPYVIKANNGCARNIFIREPVAAGDWPAIEATCIDWMHSAYGRSWGEWLYGQIVPCLLIEPLICPELPNPLDYKFWVFHGRVECIYVVSDRHLGAKVTFFSRDWQRLAVKVGNPTDERDIASPASLGKMIEAAEMLAGDLPFLRVDFYEVEDRPLFGEMTFYPSSGYDRYYPAAFGHHLLQLWRGRPATRAISTSDFAIG
jgi:hypothetical protein